MINISKEKSVEKYLHKINNLRVDRNKNKYTRGKSPHKPTLLLALLVLNKNDQIKLTDIRPDVYLKETWKDLWNSLNYNRKGHLHLPLFHLKNDDILNIQFKDDFNGSQPRSLKKLMSVVENIKLNPDLINRLDNKKNVNKLINHIINLDYYSEKEKQNLMEIISELDDSFKREIEINTLLEKKFIKDHKNISFSSIKRDPAFRRSILKRYDEKCAICGFKVTTSNAIVSVEAAHILPFYKFKNNDIRNGLSLCKNHHFLFDKGLLTINPHYQLKVSDAIEKEKPKNTISKFEENKLRLPKKAKSYPSQIALEWHRENIFINNNS